MLFETRVLRARSYPPKSLISFISSLQRRSGTDKLKLSFGAVLIIALILVVSAMLSFFWVLLTPRWSFTIATNKAVYVLDENVQITVTLKNTGYLSQSVTSGVTDPVIVSVEEFSAQAWWAPDDIQINQTTFTIAPNQSLTRVFIWDGYWWNHERHAGTYTVKATIPNAQIHEISDVDSPGGRQFYAYTAIDITS